MGVGIGTWFGSTDWKELLEHASNENLIAFSRSRWAGDPGVLLLVLDHHKWRVLFVTIAGGMAVAFLARSTLTTTEIGPTALSSPSRREAWPSAPSPSTTCSSARTDGWAGSASPRRFRSRSSTPRATSPSTSTTSSSPTGRRAFLERAEVRASPLDLRLDQGHLRRGQGGRVDAVVGVMAGDCSNTQALLEICSSRVGDHPLLLSYDRSRRPCARDRTPVPEGRDDARAAEPRRPGSTPRGRARPRWTGCAGKRTGSPASRASLPGVGERLRGDPRPTDARSRPSSPRPGAARASTSRFAWGTSAFRHHRGLYDFLESCGARVVFNETQRQFSLPYPDASLVEATCASPTPTTCSRIADIRRESSASDPTPSSTTCRPSASGRWRT